MNNYKCDFCIFIIVNNTQKSHRFTVSSSNNCDERGKQTQHLYIWRVVKKIDTKVTEKKFFFYGNHSNWINGLLSYEIHIGNKWHHIYTVYLNQMWHILYKPVTIHES